jgi:hypothetical protein
VSEGNQAVFEHRAIAGTFRLLCNSSHGLFSGMSAAPTGNRADNGNTVCGRGAEADTRWNIAGNVHHAIGFRTTEFGQRQSAGTQTLLFPSWKNPQSICGCSVKLGL